MSTPSNRLITKPELRQQVTEILKADKTVRFNATPQQVNQRTQVIAEIVSSELMAGESRIAFGALKEKLRSYSIIDHLSDTVRDTLGHTSGIGPFYQSHSVTSAVITQLREWAPLAKSQTPPLEEEPTTAVINLKTLRHRVHDALLTHPDMKTSGNKIYALTETVEQRAALLSTAALPWVTPAAEATPQEWKEALEKQMLPGSDLSKALSTVMESPQHRNMFPMSFYDFSKGGNSTVTADKFARALCQNLGQWMDVDQVSIAVAKGPKTKELQAKLANKDKGRGAA